MKTGGSCSVRCFSGICLEALRRIELLAEMISERLFGGSGALKVLLFFEIIKCMCKIYLCYRGKDVDQKGPKTGLVRSIGFRVRRDFSRFKMFDSASADSLKWWFAGSFFHSLRPIVYILALLKTADGSKSRSRWPPWLLSLTLDLLAHFVSSKAIEIRNSRTATSSANPIMSHEESIKEASRTAPLSPCTTMAPDTNIISTTPNEGPIFKDLSRNELFRDEEQEDLRAQVREHNALERTELSRRKGLLLLYLLRPPAMDAFLKPLVAILRRIIGRIPLVGSVANLLLDILVSLEHYYSYSAGS